VTTFIRSDAVDVSDPEEMPMPQLQPDDPFGEEEGEAASGLARDCGDFDAHCVSGYTFFRRDTQVRATADQLDGAHEWIYLVYDATKPGTLAPTGTTYGTVGSGTGGQAATFFLRYDGGGGSGGLGPSIIDSQTAGHQVFPDISADGGVLHALWWDSRFDPCYSVTRPIGNCANRSTTQSLDVFGAKSTDRGASWTQKSQMTDFRSNPNYEQFADRTVPFAGDYLWVTSLGDTAYGVWTDWRNTRQGTDPREIPEDEDAGTADVFQCRVVLSSTDKKGNTTTGWSGDRCPHAGGLDQDIYGDLAP
jgi:hypothetical protein